MNIQFWGATREVTGSCHLIHCGGHRILIDCGMIQGSAKDEKRNRQPFPFHPADIDAVVLSHAHIDHSGRLPLLFQQGFKGRIFCHRVTRELCRVMLRDAGYLNEKEVEWTNRKRQRKGLPLIEPLYTAHQAELAIGRFEGLDYGAAHTITPNVTLTLHDAGHILGSAIIELKLQEGNIQRTVVFSGDLGHRGKPMLPDPTVLTHADLVILESTYGDRQHRPWDATWQELHDVIDVAAQSKGNILIPAFAVDRTQELLYIFSKYHDRWNLDRWQVFLDSPLAIEATEIYMRHTELLRRDVTEFPEMPEGRLLPPNLRYSRRAEESMAINAIRQGAIIIAGSGMCSGGRIKHHLKHNIWRRETHLIIVGFQARGTIGRALVDGAKYIRLWGETIRVNAAVHTIGGLSAHADQQELVDWCRHFNGRPRLVLVHGEPETMDSLQTALKNALNISVTQAKMGETLEIYP